MILYVMEEKKMCSKLLTLLCTIPKLIMWSSHWRSWIYNALAPGGQWIINKTLKISISRRDMSVLYCLFSSLVRSLKKKKKKKKRNSAHGYISILHPLKGALAADWTGWWRRRIMQQQFRWKDAGRKEMGRHRKDTETEREMERRSW